MSNQSIREQVFDVLFSYIKRADGIYTESDCATVRDEIILLIDQSHFTADEAECFINQEVEKRIKERMPSEDEMDNEVDNRYPNVANPHIFGKQLGFGDCYFWLHSCLTCSEKPNNSQKTEGGEE